MSWEPTYQDYPDVKVHDRLGIFRGYRIEGMFWKPQQAIDLLEEVGFSPEDARAFLDSLAVEFWNDDGDKSYWEGT